MQGNRKTFTDGKYFYKEYSKDEFYFLKMLHGIDGLHLDTIIKDGIEYIEMPKGHVISIDTIPANKRNSDCIRNIIIKNIPFMIDQIILLNNLGIYYSDCMQWLYYNNRLYLIDMDTSYMTDIDYNHNNHDLFVHFLSAFNINYDYITESLRYLDLFKNDGCSLLDADIELYNKYKNDNITARHIYYSRNMRHIQVPIENIHIYGKFGNMVITETVLNPELAKEWELIRIA